MKKEILALTITAALSTGADPLPIVANSGGANITVAGPVMTVTPQADRTWIQYSSFDVAQNHTVTFSQGPHNITVNEVIGAKMSDIAGTLRVTAGSVILMNPNGMIFRDGAVIDGNMIFSSLPLQKDTFTTGGDLVFEAINLSGNPKITTGNVKSTGLSTFIAPWFHAEGTFVGDVYVLSGQRVAISLTQGQKIGFEVTGAIKESLIKIAPQAHLRGQKIVLNAGHAEQLVDSAILVEGHMNAQAMTLIGDEITLTGTSILETPVGGEIRVGIDELYDVSAADRFSHVLAKNITVQEGATLSAENGRVLLFSKNKADYQGTFDIGSGFIELSSLGQATWNLPNVHAPGGHILLDPVNLKIIGEGDSPSKNCNLIKDVDINTALRNGNMTLETSGSTGSPLNIQNPSAADASEGITVYPKAKITIPSGRSLTLSSPRIEIRGTIQTAEAAFLAGNSNRVSAYINLVNAVNFPMTVTVYGEPSYIIDPNSPLVIGGSQPLFLQGTINGAVPNQGDVIFQGITAFSGQIGNQVPINSLTAEDDFTINGSIQTYGPQTYKGLLGGSASIYSETNSFSFSPNQPLPNTISVSGPGGGDDAAQIALMTDLHPASSAIQVTSSLQEQSATLHQAVQ